MRSNDPFSSSHRGYSPEEQEAILAMASRLQNQARQEVSLVDLERAAMESGIDPRFVREAAGIVDKGNLSSYEAAKGMMRYGQVDAWVATRALLAIVVYLPIQFAVTAEMFQPRDPVLLVAAALGFSGLLAILMPKGREWRLASAAMSAVGSTVSYLILRLSSSWLSPTSTSLAGLIALAILQGLVAYYIHSANNKMRVPRQSKSKA